MKENTQKNIQITKDKQKMSWTQLGKKYGLSLTRLQRIVERTKVKYAKEVETKG